MPDGGVAPQVVGREGGLVAASPRPSLRDRFVDPAFSLSAHLGRTLSVAAAIAGLGAWLAWGAAWWMWLAIPGFWVVANLFEHTVHRYPMHKPLRPRVLYDKHALSHHRAFQGSAQQIDRVEELSAVMMPWYTLIIIFVMASPIALVAALWGGGALAGVFLLSAVSYFLVYEVIHTVHHLPEQALQRSWWGRRQWLARMRANHHHHHQMERMTKVNFNVTFALADRLLGTYERPPHEL